MVRSCLVLAVAALLAADQAAACTADPCADAQALIDLKRANTFDVPLDGVVLLQATWFGDLERLPPLLDALSLTVHLDGATVDGHLEETGVPGVLLWRPAALLAPGATYEVSGTYHNPDGVPPVCAPRAGEFLLEFTAGLTLARPLTDFVIQTYTDYEYVPLEQLDALACCDGAVPRAQEYCGVVSLTWSEGQCASTRAHIAVEADIWVDVPDSEDEPSYAQWLRTLYVGGEAVATTIDFSIAVPISGPTCFTLEQRSLITGEVVTSEEMCEGEHLDGPPEDPFVDPGDALATCVGEPYTCDIVGDEWDPGACQTLPTSPYHGLYDPRASTCNAGGNPAALPWLLGLWLFTRGSGRRRRSSTRPC